MKFDEFARLLKRDSLTVVQCHETHWQVRSSSDNSLLVDYWPTRGKARRGDAAAKSRAVPCTHALDVNRLANQVIDAKAERLAQASSMKPASHYASPPLSEALKHFPPEFVSLMGHALCGLAARYGDTKKPGELSRMAFALAEWTLDELRDNCPRKVLDDPAAVPFDPAEARRANGVRSFC